MAFTNRALFCVNNKSTTIKLSTHVDATRDVRPMSMCFHPRRGVPSCASPRVRVTKPRCDPSRASSRVKGYTALHDHDALRKFRLAGFSLITLI